jgi:WD40 repeat protein
VCGSDDVPANRFAIRIVSLAGEDRLKEQAMHTQNHRIAWAALPIILAALLDGAARAGDLADPLPRGALARLGSSRLRHTWSARVLGFAPNGKFLASAGEETGGGGDSAIRVWEIPSGREVRTLPLGYRVQVRQVAVSPDGSRVAWVDGNGALHGLEVPVAFPVEAVDPFDGRKLVGLEPVPLAFSPDGKFFATGGHGRLAIVDLDAKKVVVSAQVGDLHRCAFSPDGRTLAIVHPVAGLRLIDAKGQARKFPVLRPGPSSFAFSPDGDQLVTGEARFVKIWDVAGGKEVRRMTWGERTALAVAFSGDGRQVTAVADDGQATSWVAASGQEVQAFALPIGQLPSGGLARLQPHSAGVFNQLALSADRHWFALASQDSAVRLVDMATGKPVAFAEGQPGRHSTFALAFTPDSKHLVTAGEDDRLQVWEARTGKLVRTSRDATNSAYWFAVTPGGKQVVSLSYRRDASRTLRLEKWNFATTRRERQVDLAITPGLPALSPDGRWLALGEPNDARSRMHKTGDAILVERATGKQIRHFDAGDESAPQDLTFSAGGKMLATVGRTGTIRLWDPVTGELLRSMNAEGSEGLQYRLRFVDGDRTLVSTSMSYGPTAVSSQIVAWSVATGKAEARRAGPRDLSWCQALSPDGKVFAWAGRHDRGQGETVELWDVDRQAPRQTCTGVRGGARLLGFSPDGRLLATGGYDGTILIWGVDPE